MTPYQQIEVKTTTVRLPAATHDEIRIASAYRKQSIVDLIRESWEHFRTTQGKNLHKPKK